MGFVINISAPFLVLLLFPTLICCAQEAVAHSKATYFYASDGLGTPRGGCGYGEYGRTINDGDVAVVSFSKLYRSGAGCGACYKVRCKEAECKAEGVVVVVTDHGVSDDDTDLILSTNAFTKMALPGSQKALMDYGKVNIDYQRVACHYSPKTLLLKVVEHSHYPSYLAFQFLYQPTTADITAVELFQEDTLEWRTCRRAYGAVWDMANPPKGPLTARFFMDSTSGSAKARWVLVPKVIPAFWQPGVAYDTSIRLH